MKKEVEKANDSYVVQQLALVDEGKLAVANGEIIDVAVPQGELYDLCGVPFTVGKIKEKGLLLIPIKGYKLHKETAKERLKRLQLGG